MRAAISTVTYMHHGWAEAFDLAAAAGYRSLELLMIPGWIHLQPAALPPERLRAELARRSLALIGVHGGGLDGNGDQGAARDRDYVQALIPYAAAAGAGFVNINGSPVPPGTTSAERARMLDRIAEALRAIAPIAQAHGMVITLENHAHCHIESLDDWRHLLGAFPDAPWLGATVDTGHCAAAGVDAAAVVEALGPRVAHFHIKDHAHGRSVGLGDGTIDNARVLGAARAQGFRGHLSVELELADAASEREAAARALPYLEGLMAEAQRAPAGVATPRPPIPSGAAS